MDISRDLLEVVERLDPWDTDSIEILRSNLGEAVLESVQFDLASGKITSEEAQVTRIRHIYIFIGVIGPT